MVVHPSEERPHEPGGAGWQEAWDFSFATEDLSLAGYLRLAIVSEARAAWCWAAVVGRDQPLVAVRHHELALPAAWPHEVRGEGLWCGVFCETPMEHWTVGLEAFGVLFDDPMDAWGSERGDLVPLGFDLEWEDIGDAPPGIEDGYERSCAVTGEVLLGTQSFEVTAGGSRSHTWRIETWENGADSSDRPELVSPILVPPHRVLRAVVLDDQGTPHWEEWRGDAATAVAEAAARRA